ncbi:hypothetical protein BD324DRAFT_604335 [Kockovaella imperatae]|uniref:Nudix hydrolase domain-containing protein n=1 Tax=Kockovaella imperatae TaxID=4999 RepID=A0A1Y1UBB1_9TREE|nr:hypothetical protein BD324DRAFT_604335 [Kockovaella imperatae]ORX34807.1 hypothetical protein BD324DRAFT_604335 [Kockovaella imperatae]
MSQSLLKQLFPPDLPVASSSSSSPSVRPSSFPPQHPTDMFPDSSGLFPDPDEDGGEENIFRDMTFPDILEELNARFLVNLPKEEMGLVRVYWQAEQAHWFYEDYLRPLNPLLPSLSQRNFTHLIIASSPLYTHLSDEEYDQVWEEYCNYKRMVPCCGGILINDAADKVLMVRGWKSNAGWSFPRGKINSAEPEEACAIREVEEETGFDLTGMINKKDSIQTQVNAQTITMFIVMGIDENTTFQTQTRKEIGAIEWVPFVDLPTWTNKRGPKTTNEKGKKRFYNVTPFVGPLKRWLSEHGVNPHQKKKTQRGADPKVGGLRNLEPFQFDSPPSTPPRQPAQAQRAQPSDSQVSALDNLFDRFIHKQNQDLQISGSGDNQAGLERLFGNLAVASHQPPAQDDDKTREAKEDDDLARLLSGLTSTPTPHPPALVNPPPTEKASKLLALLNPTSPLANSSTVAQPEPSPTRAPRAPVKPHQASLLAVLSPGTQNPRTAPAAVYDDTNSIAHLNRPTTLPTSPKPPSPDQAQKERSRKQRALLEQITGGIGLKIPLQQSSVSGERSLPDANRAGNPEGIPVELGKMPFSPTALPLQNHDMPPRANNDAAFASYAMAPSGRQNHSPSDGYLQHPHAAPPPYESSTHGQSHGAPMGVRLGQGHHNPHVAFETTADGSFSGHINPVGSGPPAHLQGQMNLPVVRPYGVPQGQFATQHLHRPAPLTVPPGQVGPMPHATSIAFTGHPMSNGVMGSPPSGGPPVGGMSGAPNAGYPSQAFRPPHSQQNFGPGVRPTGPPYGFQGPIRPIPQGSGVPSGISFTGRPPSHQNLFPAHQANLAPGPQRHFDASYAQGVVSNHSQGALNGLKHPQPMPPAPAPVPVVSPSTGIPDLPRPAQGQGPGQVQGTMLQPMPRAGNAGAILGFLNDGRR